MKTAIKSKLYDKTVKDALLEVHSKVDASSEKLFEMHEKKIAGLETRILNPAYEDNPGSRKGYCNFPSFYQLDAVQFLYDKKRIMIADDMGVGKTAEAMAGKLELENRLGRKVKTLIICPSEQLRNLWEERFNHQDNRYVTKERYEGKGEFAYLGPIELKNIGIRDVEANKDPKINGADTVIVDYHALSFDLNSFEKVKRKIEEDYAEKSREIRSSNKSNQEKKADLLKAKQKAAKRFKSQSKVFSRRKKLVDELKKANFEYVILDEAHNAKNPDSSRYDHVQSLVKGAKYLSLLTGTWCPNSLEDAYAQVAFLEPARYVDVKGEGGQSKKVKIGYENAKEVKEVHIHRDPAVIGAVIRSRRLARKLTDVNKKMPRIREIEYKVKDFTPKQKDVYDSVFEDDSLIGLPKIQKLQQALLNPELIDPSYKGVSKCKFDALDKIVNHCLKRNEKIVIYSPNFTNGVLKDLEKRYSKYGALRIDGENIREREKIRLKFQQDPDNKVILVSDVAGEGIRISTANNLVLIDDPYSPGDRKQIIGRIWRPGQEKRTKVFTLNVPETIDDGIKDYLIRKNEAIEYLDQGRPLSEGQKKLLGDKKALSEYLKQRAIDINFLYTPSQLTAMALNYIKGRSENDALNKLRGKAGKVIAENLTKSWENSVLSNCGRIYSKIVKTLGKKENLEKKLDIASGFGGLSHALGETGIYNVDGAEENFKSPLAKKGNHYYVGSMTKLPFEKNDFDFALCSMALDMLPNKEDDTERVKAIAEANRVLRPGGIYMALIPGPEVPDDGSNLSEGIKELGFQPIPELTGLVESKDKKIKSSIQLITAKKLKDAPLDAPENLETLSKHFILNDSRSAKKKGRAQRRSGIAEEFEFIRPSGTESLEDAIKRYLQNKKKIAEVGA